MAIEGQLMPRHFASAEFLYQRLQVASDKPAYRQHLRDRAGVSGGWAPYEPPRPRSAGYYAPEGSSAWGDPPVHPNCRSSYAHEHDASAYRHPDGRKFYSTFIFSKIEETAGTDTRPSRDADWVFTGWNETHQYDHTSPEFLKAWDELLKHRAVTPKVEPVLSERDFSYSSNEPMGRGSRFTMKKTQGPKHSKGKRRGRWDNG